MVTAPYPGIVTERHIEVGESVTPGQPLMSGLALERLRVVVDLPQSVASEVRKKPSAALITGEGRVEAEEITLFPIADPVTNTFRVRLDLPEGQYGLYPGMFVKAAFAIGEAERLLVPASAVPHRSEDVGGICSAPRPAGSPTHDPGTGGRRWNCGNLAVASGLRRRRQSRPGSVQRLSASAATCTSTALEFPGSSLRNDY